MKVKINPSNFDEQQKLSQALVREKANADAKAKAEAVNENTYVQDNTTETVQPNTVIPAPEPVYNEDNPYVKPQAQPIVAPVQQVEQAPVQQKSQADLIMQDLFTRKEPEPVEDTAKIERLQRMGNINAIGQGMGVIGDALSLALGANVRRRQPDRVAPMIYQQYERAMDQTKANRDAWQHRDFQTTRDNLKTGYTVAVRKEAEAEARKVRADEMENRFNIAKLNADEKKEAAKLLAQYRKDTLNQREKDRLARLAGKGRASKEDKPVKIATAKKTYELTPEEVSRISNEMIGSEQARTQHPDWFDKKEIFKEDEYGVKTGTGEFEYKPKVGLSKTAMAQAYLELVEKQDENKGKAAELEAKYGTSVASGSMLKPQPTTPDISEADYAKLKKGETFFFGGKQLIKQ